MSIQSPVSRGGAAVVASAPLVLIAALAVYPYLPGKQPNVAALAEAVTSDTTHWGLVHVATGIGSALLAVAFLMISNHLRRAGEDRWSAAGLPLVIVGCTLYAMLPAMEFAPLAAVESGGDPAAAQRALFDWFRPMLIASGIIFEAGAAFFAVGTTRSAALGRAATRLVAGALVIMALSRFGWVGPQRPARVSPGGFLRPARRWRTPAAGTGRRLTAALARPRPIGHELAPAQGWLGRGGRVIAGCPETAAVS